MPARNAKPITFRPRSLSDAADGTNAPEGAMRVLTNLIPDDSTDRVFGCRPAAIVKSGFAAGLAGEGFVSGSAVVGNIDYGTVATTLNTGKDQPFAFNVLTNAHLSVSGITAANTPTQPPTTGDWTPPQLSQVGSRVIVTHPGFSEVAQFTTTTVGDTVDGTRFVKGDITTLGILPGMTISGTGIPAGALIVAVLPFQLNTQGDLHTNTTIDNIVAGTADLAVGMQVLGQDIPASATISSVDSPTQVTISNAATATGAGQNIVFAGGVYQISESATATADGVTFTITGHKIMFGWFDVSGLSIVTEGYTTSGSAIITGNPQVLGVQPGMAISGSNIPSSTTVLGAAPFVLVTTAFTVTGSQLVQDVANMRNVVVGMRVEGFGVQPDTFITSMSFGSRLLLNQPTSVGAANTVLTITGATITMSADATGTGLTTALTIAGGTSAAPQWAAGDTNRNALPSKPVDVTRMNGRAWFACGINGVVFSDSGFPCQVSNTQGVQALTTDDGLAVTCLAPLMLSSPLVTTGVVAAIIAFEGSTKGQQITGDQATGNLAMNPLNVATGTLAPNSICASEYGTFFISPHGLRLIDFTAKVSAPIGDHGTGVNVPFINAAVPSRICASANADVLRIAVDDVEYWYDLTRQVWTGPHTFPPSLIQPWSNSFVIAPQAVTGSLWVSDVTTTPSSTYVENGTQLDWEAETSLLPDNGGVMMNAMCVANLACAMAAEQLIIVHARDENEGIIDSVELLPGSNPAVLRQRGLYWSQVVVFKQLRLQITGLSNGSVQIGNHYLEYEILPYNADLGEEALDLGPYLTANDGLTILTDDHGTPLVPP